MSGYQLKTQATAESWAAPGGFHITLPPTGKGDERAIGLTSEATTKIRTFEYAAAERLSRQAIASDPDMPKSLLGLNEYVLGTVYNALGKDDLATRAYIAAAAAFIAAGPQCIRNLAYVYCDLAMTLLRVGDMRSAETYIGKSAELRDRQLSADKTFIIMRNDTLAHIDFQRGRLSDAIRIVHKSVGDYAHDATVPAELRSHVLRDYGELCVQVGRPDDALQYLHDGAKIQEEAGYRTDAAVSLAILARVEMARRRLESAESFLKEAEIMLDSAKADGLNKAIVDETYGVVLVADHKWADARRYLSGAAQLSETMPAFKENLPECLVALREADRHLHNRAEEKMVRERLKGLAKDPAQEAASESTVDLATLRQEGR